MRDGDLVPIKLPEVSPETVNIRPPDLKPEPKPTIIVNTRPDVDGVDP